MISNTSRLLPASVAAALLAACGGGSGSGSAPALSTPQSTSMPLLVSDASTEDWATIGVKVLSIALVPQGGGSNAVVYTAPSPAPMVNLAQLDQIGEILGNVSVPVGTYTGAVLTVSGNASDRGGICRASRHHHRGGSDPGSAHDGQRFKSDGAHRHHV